MKIRNRGPDAHSVLPADILLSILDEEEGCTEKVLDWYDHYIHKVAADCIEKGLQEDLIQEMRISLAACLPALRRRMNRPILIVVT